VSKAPEKPTIAGPTSEVGPTSSASLSGERRRVFDVAAIGIGILAIDGRWLSANASLGSLVGYSPEEILAMSLDAITHPDDADAGVRERARLIAGETLVSEREIRLVHRSGARVWVHERVTLSRDNAGRPLHFLWQGRDVTEHLRARHSRNQAKELLRVVVEHAPIVLWATDRHGVFTLCEGSDLSAMGTERMTVGSSAFEVYDGVRVTDGEQHTTTGDALLRRALSGTAATGLVEIGEARYDTKMSPLFGPEGEVVGVIGVATDVTERVRAEAHLLQTDRLIALGTLAAGVAHEINNPLTYVMRNLDLVSRLMGAKAEECRSAASIAGPKIAESMDELASMMKVAVDGAERVARIVRDLTTFAHSTDERRTFLDVRAVLDPVLRLVASEVQQRAHLVRKLDEVPLVYANEARLGQVFMNVLINAAQAIPEGHAEDNEICVSTSTDDAGRAVIEVHDTGSGMPDDVVSRVFEPFFTTKPVGVGSGLGLSICHGTIVSLGGEISVRTRPGEGSTFHIAIPPASLSRRAAETRASF
jgi:two-component system, cell cycle sensor histidine kinase and response regulator CckA